MEMPLQPPWIEPRFEQVVRDIRNRKRRIIIPGDPEFQGELRPYQHDGVAVLYFTRRLILGDSTGLGKTVQTLRLLRLLKTRGEVTTQRPALVVVPPNSLDSSWVADGFETFSPWPALRYTPLSGEVTPQRRHRIYARHMLDTILINYNTLLRDAKRIQRAYPDGFGALVCDEGSMMKNHSTQTAHVLKDLGRFASRIVILTATPIQTALLDLHSLLEVLQLNAVFGTAYAFEREYYNTEVVERYIPGGRKIRVRERSKTRPYQNLPQLREKLWPYYYRRTYADLPPGEMPELTSSVEWLDMTPPQERVYDALRRRVLPSTSSARRFNMQSRAMYLKQIATSLQTFIPDGADHSAKLDRLIEKLRGDWSQPGWDGNPMKIVVYSTWKQTIVTLMDRLRAEGLDAIVLAGMGELPGGATFPYGLPPSQREPLRQRFLTDPLCRVCIGTSAIEMALNLPVAPVLVNLDLPTNPARVQQIAGRIWRQNSKYRFVHVVSFLSLGSVEEGVLRILQSRQNVIDTMNGDSPSTLFGSLTDADLESLITHQWQR